MESKETLPAMTLSLEESTTERVPRLLEEILKRVIPEFSRESIQKDYLFIVIIVSMFENGFVLVDNDCQIIDHNLIDTKQLCEWKSQSGVYEALFILYGFKHISLKLIMSPLSALVLVNVVIIDLDSETYSVCLPVSRFVVSPQATTIPMIFRDLKQFSLTFKNKILAAVKSRILMHHGYASASLIGLPEELLFKIMLILNVNDVLNVSKTCMTLNMVLQSDILWHGMVKRDFQENHISQPDFNWKEIYKKSHILKYDEAQRRLQQAAGTLHDFVDYSDYVSYIDNPMWNII
ncbi:putative f-box only protein 7-like isoform 1 [Operophtera brumata]|uniref:Putative f-box only protein 7-like isoform 1 n=1 Tax=Operophtera brumata TaxID=104452 RepID=A0A0L7KZP5_OPEBR|nr:putative f-box only protein 7-like isoform 1 [Operophtera brumata]